ncbi:MAG: hypothetical protein II994_09195 [Lachnospiraceae bacterium]|nr:hypothetical protein [Lachnospiraceae bacterium]
MKQKQSKSQALPPRKKLEELNLLDNFLFGSMVTHPEYGEQFSRSILQIILNRKFDKLTVIPQKVYYGSDTDLHGARLDVYLARTPYHGGNCETRRGGIHSLYEKNGR